MYIQSFKFDIEKISDTIVKHIEEMLEDKTSVANDYKILTEQFGKVIELKKKLKLLTIDIVFIYENKRFNESINYDEYKLEIAEIYNRLNYKITESKKIPMFSRGTINIPSFHLPAGLNIFFLEAKNFINSKLKPVIVINFEVNGILSYLKSKFDNKENKDFFEIMKYYHVSCNDHFSMEKHIIENWGKK
jgi:hypothetical protein